MPDILSGGASDDDAALPFPALLVGLGNPGPRYASTLHNAGFAVLEALARHLGAPPFQRSGQSLVTRTTFASRPLLLVEPETFMNLSGLAVAEALASEPRAELFVIHDDLDLPFGSLRFKWRGGAGGHRGIASIVGTLGHGDFARLRVGCGRPSLGLDAAQYVLEPLERDRRETFLAAAEKAAEALVLALEKGLSVAMNTVNRRAEPAPPAELPADAAATG